MLSATSVQKTDHRSACGADTSIELRSAQNTQKTNQQTIPSVSAYHGRSYCLQKTTHAVSPVGVTRHVDVYCFLKKEKEIILLTLYWQQQRTWFLRFSFAFQGKTRRGEAWRLWRDAQELSGSPSQMLHARCAWKLLFPHVVICLAGSHVSSPSCFSEKTQACLVCRAATGAVCWGPLSVHIWSPPAG